MPILSKVLGKLVLKRFILFIRDDLNTLQFAYIPGVGFGTSCALTLLYDRILNFLGTPGAVRILTVDFSVAFDKVLYTSVKQFSYVLQCAGLPVKDFRLISETCHHNI